MKRYVALLAVCGLLGVTGVGCGGTQEETLPNPEQQAPEEKQPDTVSPEEGTQGEQPNDGKVHQQARNCQTTCTAVRFDTGGQCAPITGFGSTTFLGGCTKACRFAHDDAQSQAAAASCRIVSCNDQCPM